MVLVDKKDQKQKPRLGGSGARRVWWPQRFWVASWSRLSEEEQFFSSSSSSSPSRRKRKGETTASEKRCRNCWRSMLLRWKEEAQKKERDVELRASGGVGQGLERTACSNHECSLTTPPHFPPSPLGVLNLPLVAEERERGKNGLLGAPQLRWIEAELLHKVSYGRNGVTKDEFNQTLGEQFGDRRFVAALGEFITRHGSGAAVPRAKEGRSGLTLPTNSDVLSLPQQAFIRLGLGMWTLHVSPGAVSGYVCVSKPGPYLSVLQSYWNFMCGIGRKRCSSRPSHDTLGCRPWSMLISYPLWVALAASWCLWC